MARLALSEDDIRVRNWFASEVQQLGCTLSVDQMGNMFARQAGRLKSKVPMIAMGRYVYSLSLSLFDLMISTAGTH